MFLVVSGFLMVFFKSCGVIVLHFISFNNITINKLNIFLCEPTLKRQFCLPWQSIVIYRFKHVRLKTLCKYRVLSLGFQNVKLSVMGTFFFYRFYLEWTIKFVMKHHCDTCIWWFRFLQMKVPMHDINVFNNLWFKV